MDILIWALIIIGGTAGLLSTLYLVVAMPVFIVWKAYRKVKFGRSMFD